MSEEPWIVLRDGVVLVGEAARRYQEAIDARREAVTFVDERSA